MLEWLTSPDGIAAVIQIFILVVLLLTFLHASRPYVGIIRADSLYDAATKDFAVVITIKNSGTAPANNVRSEMKMFLDGNELGVNEGKSRYILFPGQENSGRPVFHNVEPAHLSGNEFKIIVELTYEQPIHSFLPIPLTVRKYTTKQEMVYDAKVGKFAVTAGAAI